MALIRQVMINGAIFRYHELVMLQLVRDQHIVATVESFADSEAKAGGEEPYDSFHELSYADGITFADAEAILWALPDFEEARDESRELLDEVLEILTDEQAETVPNAYPEWQAQAAYRVGDRRRYDGLLYRCVQAHTSQVGWEPPSVPALWVRTSHDGEIPEWVQPTGAHDAYALGDKVKHNGKVWQSDIDANVFEPGVYGWTEVA